MRHLDKRGPEYQEILRKRYVMSLHRRLEGWTEALKHTEEDSRQKYNPRQPRVPAGSSTGGRWSGGAGAGSGLRPRTNAPAARQPAAIHPPMSAAELERFNRHAPPGTPPRDLEIDPRFGLPRWYVGGAVSPTVSPLDFIGGGGGAAAEEEGLAAIASSKLMRTRSDEALSAARLFMSGQPKPPELSLPASSEEALEAMRSNQRVRDAYQAIEDFFGEPLKSGDVKKNNAGDIYIEKGTKKFRMDINNPGPDKSGKTDSPHFHLEELKKGKWKDLGKSHRNYFKR